LFKESLTENIVGKKVGKSYWTSWSRIKIIKFSPKMKTLTVCSCLHFS